MTVTYTAEVATSSFACFLKLLIRWRGSIYKLMWREFLIFVLCYYLLSFIYRFALTESQMRIFEMVSRYCEAYNSLIPVAFVLGFYVSIVVARWWEQFNNIPWPDRMALFITANMHGHDDRGRLMRRTVMRYLCLSFVITLSSISPAVKKRFPTFSHMMEAGFMQSNELKVIEDIQTSHNKYFVPLVWATSLVTRARKEGRIKDDFAVKTLIDELNEFRGMLGTLFNYDWISVPLVYTQVVTLSVYMFFLSCLMGRQFLQSPNTQSVDMYIPIFTFLQFFFYLGWLKVAESLVNPFGEDDDDFDVNTVIDRNLQVSYLVVDEMHAEHPELIKDAYWDDVDFELPYTAAAEHFRPSTPHLGSAMAINIPSQDAGFVPLISIAEHQEVNFSDSNMYPKIPDIKQQDSDQGPEYQPSYSTRMGLLRFLKRSTSRDSANIRNPALLDSPMSKRQRKKMRRQESMTTQSQATSNPPSPSGTSRQEDIFMMTDLSDREEDLDVPIESAITSRSSSLFFPTIRPKHKTAKRKDDDQSGPGDATLTKSTVDALPSTVKDKPPSIPLRKAMSADQPSSSVLSHFTASRDTIDKTPDDEAEKTVREVIKDTDNTHASTDTLPSMSPSNGMPSLSSSSVKLDMRGSQPLLQRKSSIETEC